MLNIVLPERDGWDVHNDINALEFVEGSLEGRVDVGLIRDIQLDR